MNVNTHTHTLDTRETKCWKLLVFVFVYSLGFLFCRWYGCGCGERSYNTKHFAFNSFDYIWALHSLTLAHTLRASERASETSMTNGPEKNRMKTRWWQRSTGATFSILYLNWLRNGKENKIKSRIRGIVSMCVCVWVCERRRDFLSAIEFCSYSFCFVITSYGWHRWLNCTSVSFRYLRWQSVHKCNVTQCVTSFIEFAHAVWTCVYRTKTTTAMIEQRAYGINSQIHTEQCDAGLWTHIRKNSARDANKLLVWAFSRSQAPAIIRRKCECLCLCTICDCWHFILFLSFGVTQPGSARIESVCLWHSTTTAIESESTI